MIIQTTGAGQFHPREREHLLVMARAMKDVTLRMMAQKLDATVARINRSGVVSKSDHEAMLKDLADLAGLGHSLQQNADAMRKRAHEYMQSKGDSSPRRK